MSLDVKIEPSKANSAASVVALLAGIGGGPLSYVLCGLTESFVPMIACSVLALAYVYLAQRKFLVRHAPPRWHLLAIAGTACVFIWAPLCLIWSVSFTFVKV